MEKIAEPCNSAHRCIENSSQIGSLKKMEQFFFSHLGDQNIGFTSLPEFHSMLGNNKIIRF